MRILKEDVERVIESEEVKVAKYPKCDFCKEPAHYDGKTKNGPWAYMCDAHYKQYGLGKLGTGYGQKLIVKEAYGDTLVNQGAGTDPLWDVPDSERHPEGGMSECDMCGKMTPNSEMVDSNAGRLCQSCYGDYEMFMDDYSDKGEEESEEDFEDSAPGWVPRR